MRSVKWINSAYALALVVLNMVPAFAVGLFSAAFALVGLAAGFATGHRSTTVVGVGACLTVGVLFNLVLFKADRGLAGVFAAEAGVTGVASWTGARLAQR